MADINILDVLYAKDKTALEFRFDSLMAPPLYTLLSPKDIYDLHKIATSIRYNSKPKVKYKMIDDILKPRGFRKLASGTNRITYKYLEDQSICIKVAIDRVGLSDTPNEYMNQFKLQPFVTKVFEYTQCGTVGVFERVHPITSIEEYLTAADDIYELIYTKIIGKYVVDDIGSKFFQNMGLRKGFGPVLLDFPYVYELDGNKLYCKKKDLLTGAICGGEIDYDDGFNNIVCKKCGKKYFARDLESDVKKHNITTSIGGLIPMKIKLTKGNKVIREFNEETKSANTLPVSKGPELSVDFVSQKEAKKNRYKRPKNNGKNYENVTMNVSLKKPVREVPTIEERVSAPGTSVEAVTEVPEVVVEQPTPEPEFEGEPDPAEYRPLTKEEVEERKRNFYNEYDSGDNENISEQDFKTEEGDKTLEKNIEKKPAVEPVKIDTGDKVNLVDNINITNEKKEEDINETDEVSEQY